MSDVLDRAPEAPRSSPDVDLSPPREGRTEPLEQQLERYRSFMRLTEEGIWCFEIHPPVPLVLERDESIRLWLERGRLVECNDALARMYGYTHAEELIGAGATAFLPLSNPQNVEYLRKFWQNGLSLRDGESQRTDRHGNVRDFLDTLTGVTRAGCLEQVWGTQRDVSERKLLETRLLRAQKMEAIGQLAGGIAHDFNNMLMVIEGNISVVRDSGQLSADDVEALEEARGAVERASQLTQQLLTFSRRGIVQHGPIDVAGCVRQLWRVLRRMIPENVAFELDLPPSSPPVFCEAGQIQRMLVNLAMNARDAMPSGGRLDVSVRTEVTDQRCWVVLRVSDTGAGMSRQTRERVFDPFFTLKPPGEGTGLGLSVVYGIVARAGGSIDVGSEVGCGSTFTIRLPAAVETPMSATSADRGSTRNGPLTVLLVEDQVDVLELIRRFLKASGHHVLTAKNAAEGYEIAHAHADEIDLLICDVVMPGSSGIELAHKLHELRSRTRVLLTSGYAELPKLAEGLADVGFIAKPFTRPELDRRIRELLE